MNSTNFIEHSAERLVLLGSADERTVKRISISLVQARQSCRCVGAVTVDKLHEALRRRAPCVVLLDDRILGGASLEETLLRLTELAPVAQSFDDQSIEKE